MAKIVATLKVELEPGKERAVDVIEAQQGPHRGDLYLSCKTFGCRWSWSPAGYRPCKHAAAVIDRFGIELVDSHFAALPPVALTAVAA